MIEFVVPIDENTVPKEFVDDMRKRYTERKKGEWIDSFGLVKCSECKTEFFMMYNFCPNCGSRMGGRC